MLQLVGLCLCIAPAVARILIVAELCNTGVQQDDSNITTSYKVGLAALGIGIMMNIAGVASPGWLIVSRMVFIGMEYSVSWTIGLWKYCNDGSDCKDLPDAAITVNFKVCQAFSILGIIFNGFAFILSAIFLVLPMINRVPNKVLTYAAFALGMTGVVSSVICLAVYGTRTRYEVDPEGRDLFYSFYLTAFSLLPILVGNVVTFAQGYRYRTPNVPV